MHTLNSSAIDDRGAAVQGRTPSQAYAVAHVECDSVGLFNGAAEVRIKHLGQEYRLRQTRNGKLILTK